MRGALKHFILNLKRVPWSRLAKSLSRSTNNILVKPPQIKRISPFTASPEQQDHTGHLLNPNLTFMSPNSVYFSKLVAPPAALAVYTCAYLHLPSTSLAVFSGARRRRRAGGELATVSRRLKRGTADKEPGFRRECWQRQFP